MTEIHPTKPVDAFRTDGADAPGTKKPDSMKAGEAGSPLEAFLKRHLPERAIDVLRAVVPWMNRLGGGDMALLRSLFYDYGRYRKWSSAATGANTKPKLLAHIVKDYHRLEKGLALPEPRPNFGRPVVRRLLRNCKLHVARYGLEQQLYDAAGAIQVYCEFQERCGVDVSDVRGEMASFEKEMKQGLHNMRGGTTSLDVRSIVDATSNVGASFFSTRHSVRQFSGTAIEASLIDEALRRAQRTPSVCNRQCARVHVLKDPEIKARALSFQNGNRGFGHQADVVFIVTADLSAFTDAGERFQGWIDGGMYAMSLVYALHSLGLGSCTLNWSVTSNTDRRMRKAMQIPENELVIMMIAAGHLPEDFEVATSPRMPIEATTRYHHPT